MSGKVIVVAGPSCAGKSPLVAAMKKWAPELLDGFQTPVPYHSRAPRPDEIDGEDYHFRSAEEIYALRDKDSVRVFEARADVQALDFADLDDSSCILYEGHGEIALCLKRWGLERNMSVTDMFLSPLSAVEIKQAIAAAGHRAFERQLIALSRARLTRRYQLQKADISLEDLEDIEVRAQAAPKDLALGFKFSHVIPNHDGEDSNHWTVFPTLIGDARRATEAAIALLRGQSGREESRGVEAWEDGDPPLASV